MNKIETTEQIQQLRERFYDFTDSDIHQIVLEYGRKKGIFSTLQIDIYARYLKLKNMYKRVCVSLIFDDVKEYQITGEYRCVSPRISDGIHLLKFEDTIGIDFGDMLEDPKTIEDLRQSDSYVIARSLSYEVNPIPEV